MVGAHWSTTGARCCSNKSGGEASGLCRSGSYHRYARSAGRALAGRLVVTHCCMTPSGMGRQSTAASPSIQSVATAAACRVAVRRRRVIASTSACTWLFLPSIRAGGPCDALAERHQVLWRRHHPQSFFTLTSRPFMTNQPLLLLNLGRMSAQDTCPYVLPFGAAGVPRCGAESSGERRVS